MSEPVQVVGIGSCGVDYFAIVPRLLGPEEKMMGSTGDSCRWRDRQ